MPFSYTHIKDKMLIKIGAFNVLWLSVKLTTGLISIKVIAIFLGSEGMAFIGNVRNLLTAVRTISIGGMYNGVVHHISEQRRHKEQVTHILSTTYYIGYVTMVIMAFVLYYASDFWNTLIFGRYYQYSYVFEAMAIALPLYATNALCMAILKGFSKTKIYVLITIISSLLGLLITLLLITEMKLEGAFLAIVLNPAISLLITIIIIVNQRNLVKLLWADKVSLQYIKKLIPYMALSFASIVLIPIVLIQIRNYIIEIDGVTNAGYWEAMQRFSHQYIYCIVAIIGVYLTPKLVTIPNSVQLRKEIVDFYKVVLPLTILALVVLYLSRTLWIKIVFSDDFLSMEPLFMWQLVGDFFKVVTMAIVCVLIAKKKYWHFVLAKVILFILLYSISFYCVKNYGFIGGSIGYCMSYIAYLGVVLIVCGNSLFGRQLK